MKLWAVVPAAGQGRRFFAAADAGPPPGLHAAPAATPGGAEAGRPGQLGGALPKQYLQLQGRSVLEWALAPLLARDDIQRVVVVIGADDTRWPQLTVARHPRIQTVHGGAERADSVRNGIAAIAGVARGNDWVLVHDAARPCLSASDLQLLIETVGDDEVGGLLATPLADTLKRADLDRVQATVSRAHLWRALTPQMFRHGILARALDGAAARGAAVTDESAAVELLGLQPRLVPGRADNVKITAPQDLALARQVLDSWKSSR